MPQLAGAQPAMAAMPQQGMLQQGMPGMLQLAGMAGAQGLGAVPQPGMAAALFAGMAGAQGTTGVHGGGGAALATGALGAGPVSGVPHNAAMQQGIGGSAGVPPSVDGTHQQPGGATGGQNALLAGRTNSAGSMPFRPPAVSDGQSVGRVGGAIAVDQGAQGSRQQPAGAQMAQAINPYAEQAQQGGASGMYGGGLFTPEHMKHMSQLRRDQTQQASPARPAGPGLQVEGYSLNTLGSGGSVRQGYESHTRAHPRTPPI
jgi:hypothetical protein